MMPSSFFTVIGSYLLQHVRRENHAAKVEINIFTYYSRRFTSCTSSSVPYIMESFNFTALFSLLDKEKQQIALLSHVNLIPPQNKEVGQGASVQE